MSIDSWSIHTCDLLDVRYCVNYSVHIIMKNGYTAHYWTFQSTQKLTKYEVCQILDACPTSPLGPIFLIFMQLFGEIWPNNRLAPFPLCSPPIWEIRIRILDVNRTTPCRVTQNVCTWNVQFSSSRGSWWCRCDSWFPLLRAHSELHLRYCAPGHPDGISALLPWSCTK